MQKYCCPNCSSEDHEQRPGVPFYQCGRCGFRSIIIDLEHVCQRFEDATPRELFEIATQIEWKACRLEAQIDKGVSL